MNYVDHIDENDDVIAQITRQQAHDEFLLHRSVHILVENSKKEILVHIVGRNKRIFQLHFHTSAGGHVDAGDSYDEAAKRELEEELGIQADLTYIGQFRQHVYPLENEICRVYLTQHDGPYSNWEKEAEGILFFPRADLDRLVALQPQLFTPTLKDAYRLLREKEEKAA